MKKERKEAEEWELIEGKEKGRIKKRKDREQRKEKKEREKQIEFECVFISLHPNTYV